MTFSNVFKANLVMASLFTGALKLPISASAQIFDRSTGNVLLGAGIGAGLGGILGSNLAGTGVQQEGTAIGMVVGGIAGAAIANRWANQGASYNTNRRSSRYGGYVPSYGPGYRGYDYGYEYSAQRRYSGRRTPVAYSTFGGSLVNTNAHGNTHAGSGYSRTFIQPSFIQPVLWPRTQYGTQYIQGPHLVQIYTIPYVMPQVYTPPAPTNVYCYAGSNQHYDRSRHKITTRSAVCR